MRSGRRWRFWVGWDWIGWSGSEDEDEVVVDGVAVVVNGGDSCEGAGGGGVVVVVEGCCCSCWLIEGLVEMNRLRRVVVGSTGRK